MSKVLIIGFGSIGQRHARLLSELGCQVAVVSRRSIDFNHCYSDLVQALDKWKPDTIVVANRTNEHYQTLSSLAKYGFQGRVLVEKPLFDNVLELPTHTFSLAVVAYNLRCHPLLRKLRSLLVSEQLITANIYVGSYLPDWRPNTDYRQSYSAKKSQGGGVLRDLSHELDYALWFFGPWQRLTALGGHLSSLTIDSDDAYSLLMQTARCPLVSIHMNYLDRVTRREIVINTHQYTIHADLIKNKLSINGIEEDFKVARDGTYRAEHQAMLNGNAKGLCTFEEARETLLTIEAAEKASSTKAWIER